MTHANYQDLFHAIGFEIPQKELLDEAFTHRSAHPKAKTSGKKHNERLEFLGDAVLELITTEYLYFHFPEAQEGQMTNYRSALVRGAHLAKVSRALGFGAYLVMSSGERKSGGADKDYLLANSMESFIGAIYLSQGMDITRKFIADFIIVNLDDIIASGDYIDSKSEFQEVAQAKFGVTPNYEVLRTEGKDHDRTFTVGAFLGDRQVGEGQGSSKKIAQTAAADNALQNQTLWKA